MTVQELIDKLQEIEDKSKEVRYLDNEDMSCYISYIINADTIVYLY